MTDNHAAKYAFQQYAIRGFEAPTDKEGQIDHTAVVITLAVLEGYGKSRCVEVVRYVLFHEPESLDHRGEVNRRIVRFSTRRHVSIPTAYRWLSEAYDLYAMTREAIVCAI